ncbi:MAG: TonB-dependent receptor, partial [Bacteroidota bacterium]|nr:TonB-dependent receptor [Bacteroidota bacterium]
PRMTANLSVRKEFVPDQKIKPLFSLGARYMLKSDRLYLRANGANKFRLPTFNDKYWQPGGNRNLKPEEGWTADMGLEAYLIHDKGVQNLFLDVSAYTSTIRNMIVWTTTSPKNLKEIWARGVELSLNYSYKVQDFLFTMNAFYSHSPSTNIKATDSESEIIGKQIIYVPVQTSKAYMNLSYRQFYLAYSAGYTGQRYSSENNDIYNRMSSFICSNVYAGYTFKIRGVDGGLQFKVSNLFDQQYQLMPGYAMPGRTYYVSLNLGIDKRKY